MRSRDEPSPRIADILGGAVTLAPDGRGRCHVPPSLQSWPGIVHGGGLAALLDASAVMFAGLRGAELRGARRVEARLTSSVPVDTPLAIDAQPGEDAVRLTIVQDGQTLGGGAVGAINSAPDTTSAPWTGREPGWRVPLSEHCLACGALNPLGLQAQLYFDDEGVWVSLTPREPWRGVDGSVHRALAPVLLDEVAWWLGALVMKEGGLTNRIDVTFHRLDATDGFSAGAGVVAAGRFDDVTPVDRRRAFWRTRTMLSSRDGVLLASASIVFRGGAEYSSRQIEYFRARSTAETFRRMFPNYAR